MFAERFAGIAAAIGARYGGPFHAGRLVWPGEPVLDDGGSIVEPGTPVAFDCSVQIDACTEAMRAEAGYTDRDVRLIVLAPGLGRALDSDATIEVLAGPHAGTYSVQGQTLDPVGVAFDGRGRVE